MSDPPRSVNAAPLQAGEWLMQVAAFMEEMLWICDAGSASCARRSASAALSQGFARSSGWETCSMASISIDSQSRSSFPALQDLAAFLA